MFYVRSARKVILFFMMNVIFLLPSVVSANAGTGNGDGDGISGYRSSSNAKVVRGSCEYRINIVDNTPNNDAAYALGACLMNVREAYRFRYPNNMYGISTCGMLDIAADEACRGHWGLFGVSHQNCAAVFTAKVVRQEGWFRNFGYCNKSCINNAAAFHSVTQYINAYPVDRTPCGIRSTFN